MPAISFAQKNSFIAPEFSFDQIAGFQPAFVPSVTAGLNIKNGGSVGMGIGLLKFKYHSVGVPVYLRMLLYSARKKVSPLFNTQLGYYALNDTKLVAQLKGGVLVKFGIGMIVNKKVSPYCLVSFEGVQMNTSYETKMKTGSSFSVGVKF